MPIYTILEWVSESGSEIEKVELVDDAAAQAYMQNTIADTGKVLTAETLTDDHKHRIILP